MHHIASDAVIYDLVRLDYHQQIENMRETTEAYY